jgi:Fe-S-cluster-containing dehydrogenase component
MDESRRNFLKGAGCAALGLSCGFPLLRAALGASEPHAGGAAASLRQWGMVIDVQKCLRDDVRQACIAACNREHNIPTIPDPKQEIKWIWPDPYENVFPDQVHPHTPTSTKEMPILILCNHCTTPPCVRVCPTQATWKRKEDGIVMMDMHRCIGCRYCIAACPYGARSFNWQDPRPFIPRDANGKFPTEYPTRTKGVVEKCSFCEERIRDGRQPACVEAANSVPGGEGALTFGDLSQPDSNVNRVLRERNTMVRRVNMGTGPNVFYIV